MVALNSRTSYYSRWMEENTDHLRVFQLERSWVKARNSCRMRVLLRLDLKLIDYHLPIYEECYLGVSNSEMFRIFSDFRILSNI